MGIVLKTRVWSNFATRPAAACIAATLLFSSSACDNKVEDANEAAETTTTGDTGIVSLISGSQGDSSNEAGPDLNAKRAMIETSLNDAWRGTPYEIISISYDDEITFHDEKTSNIDKTGTSYKAIVSLVLAFPEGSHASCIGPGARWGCQFIDANIMQVHPIPVGGRRTYVGALSASGLRHGDREWDSGVAWTQNRVVASASGAIGVAAGSLSFGGSCPDVHKVKAGDEFVLSQACGTAKVRVPETLDPRFHISDGRFSGNFHDWVTSPWDEYDNGLLRLTVKKWPAGVSEVTVRVYTPDQAAEIDNTE